MGYRQRDRKETTKAIANRLKRDARDRVSMGIVHFPEDAA